MQCPSARVLERMGFKPEGLLHERWIVRGEPSDSAIYGLLRKDRLGRKPSRGGAVSAHPDQYR